MQLTNTHQKRKITYARNPLVEGDTQYSVHGLGLLSDHDIKDIIEEVDSFISPFLPTLVREVDGTPIISKGLSSAGYDASLAGEVLLITSVDTTVLMDPKRFNGQATALERHHDDDGSEYVILPPNGFVLGHTVETFHIPSNVTATCIGKSTYARNGIHILVTPLEPGWKGQVTLEIRNELDLPTKLYINEGICQFIFQTISTIVDTDYQDRGGKYQGQSGVTLPKV